MWDEEAAGSGGVILLDQGRERREGYAEIGDVGLHYVEAGDGPLIVLLPVAEARRLGRRVESCW
jgi:hypothetical protein